MKNRSVTFDAPDLFTCGAIGEPGQRVFYLQAREASDLLTLRMEKQQVAALATYLAGILADLAPDALETATASPELVAPVEEDWVAGSLAIGIEADGDRVLVVVEELTEEGVEGASARVLVDHLQAAGFVPRAEQLLAAGRPTCALCGRPMDPDGHRCPRRNGHGAP